MVCILLAMKNQIGSFFHLIVSYMHAGGNAQ